MIPKDYTEILKRRAKESRVYRDYQLLGLEIADVLRDRAHKALYIRLAKERKGRDLLRIAKEIAEKHNVKNRGAYFMRVISQK